MSTLNNDSGCKCSYWSFCHRNLLTQSLDDESELCFSQVFVEIGALTNCGYEGLVFVWFQLLYLLVIWPILLWRGQPHVYFNQKGSINTSSTFQNRFRVSYMFILFWGQNCFTAGVGGVNRTMHCHSPHTEVVDWASCLDNNPPKGSRSFSLRCSSYIGETAGPAIGAWMNRGYK